MIGQTISHYRVLSPLGSGGMGVVYEAEDLELGRHVALKFLATTLSADPQAIERFKREARAASALNHPHICTIHDIGTFEGQPFIVMERLEGQTLNQLQPRPLRFDLLLSVAIQIADALQAAHSAGFIHRDIKPANVFLTTRGEAKLLDFGLAKLVRQQPGAPDPHSDSAPTISRNTMTEQGAIVGTLGYMSPEQIRGEELDARTDLFSFGALLYELATGFEPFACRNAALVIDAVLNHDPAPPSQVNPHCPPDLERVICRAIEKDPGMRYQTAASLRTDLERVKRESSGVRAGDATTTDGTREVGSGFTAKVTKRAAIVGAGLMLLVAVATSVAYRFAGRAPRLTERDAIVITDFENTTGDAVFDDALKRALTAQLEQSPFLTIVTGERVATTLRLMGRPPGERLTRTTAREVCQRESVKAMLVGSIGQLGANYVITLEAVNCVTGDLLATVQGEAHGKEDVLQAVATAARTLRARLGEALPSIQRYDVPIRQAATGSLEALKLFSTAMAERDRGDDGAALPLLERAVQIDPDFALAWAHFSSCLMHAGRLAESREAIARAFAKRDHAPEQERYFISYRYYAGAGELDKAVETSKVWATVYPRNWMPHYNLCSLYWQVGDTERALAECHEALRLEPSSIYPYDAVVYFSMALGRLDEARRAAEQWLKMNLSAGIAHRYLAQIAWLQGDGAALEPELAWLRTNAASEHADLQYEMDLAAGRLQEATRIRRLGPLVLAWVGNLNEARKQAEQALRQWQASSRPPPENAILAVALAGNSAWVDKVADFVAREAPNNLTINNVALPATRAALELSRGDGVRAVELLEPARRHGFGLLGFTATYLRGLGYLQAHHAREAAAEFDKIIAHRGVDPGSVIWPLAHLGLARARALSGDTAGSRSAYERFLFLWSDADQDLPVLQEAKLEYARLGPAKPTS